MAVKSREHVRPIPGVLVCDADILVRLETDRRRLVGYAVVLRVFEAGEYRSVRLSDYVRLTESTTCTDTLVKEPNDSLPKYSKTRASAGGLQRGGPAGQGHRERDD